MRDWIKRDGIKHLTPCHMERMGLDAAATHGVTLSVTIEDKGRNLPKSATIQLMGSCNGVRFERRPSYFRCRQHSSDTDALYLLIHRQSRPLEGGGCFSPRHADASPPGKHEA
jgi:hypothetical protein